MQVAAFYPFARQFDEDGGNEPWNMSDESFKSMAQSALKDRLKYSSHLYTCLKMAES